MATLFDGTRVFSAADGATALAVDQNNWQDHCITAFEERYIDCLGMGHPAGGATAWDSWAMDANVAQIRWVNSTTDTETVLIPIPVLVDQVITELRADVTGTNNLTAGSISLVYGDGTTTTVVDIDDVADCWDTGGTAIGNLVTYTETVNLTVTEGQKYFFEVVSASNVVGIGGTCNLFSARAKIQFGN